jgi:hypothetical protein
MSNFGDMVAGLQTVLQTNVTGLQVYDYPAHIVNVFPAAVILPMPLDYEIAFGGNTFTTQLRVVVLVASADDGTGFRLLYDYIDPTDSAHSIRRAVRADRTLNGKADDADVIAAENIGQRELWGGFYYGFDAIVEVIKSVS